MKALGLLLAWVLMSSALTFSTVSGSVGSVPVPSPAMQLAPSITVNPSSGIPGTSITIRGTGFARPILKVPLVTIRMDGQVLTEVGVRIDGAFDASAVVPSLPPGQVKVEATDDVGNRAAAPFTILSPILQVTPSSGRPGSIVTITGANFPRFTVVSAITVGGVSILPTPAPNTDNLGAFSVTVVVPNLTPGVHRVTANVGQLSATTIITITEPAPVISYSPPSIGFQATEGGTNPANQFLTIQNAGGGALNWTVSGNASWLTLTPSSGASTGEAGQVTLAVSMAGLGAGSYNATVTISAPGSSNTPQTIPVTLVLEQEGVPWELVVTIVAGVTVAVGGLTFGFQRTIKLRRRTEWGKKATEEEPEDSDKPCQPGTRQCTKKLDAEPALRRVTYLTLMFQGPRPGEQRQQRQVGGKPVEELNQALAARSRGEGPEQVRARVTPIADGLSEEIADWLRPTPGPHIVDISGHIEGGKVTATFTLRLCKRGTWEEEDKWKATWKDEKNESMGTLHDLDAAEPRLGEWVAPELTSMLTRLIDRV